MKRHSLTFAERHCIAVFRLLEKYGIEVAEEMIMYGEALLKVYRKAETKTKPVLRIVKVVFLSVMLNAV